VTAEDVMSITRLSAGNQGADAAKGGLIGSSRMEMAFLKIRVWRTEI